MSTSRITITPALIAQAETDIKTLRQLPPTRSNLSAIEAIQNAIDQTRLSMDSPSLYSEGSLSPKPHRVVIESAIQFVRAVP